jgi:transitional endoplasmic reticulum ATPase
MLKRQLNNPHLLHYMACEWTKRLLHYVKHIDANLIDGETITYLRGQKVPATEPYSYGRLKNFAPVLTIKDRYPQTTKIFLNNCQFIQRLLVLPKGATKLIQFSLLSQANQWFQNVATMVHMHVSDFGLNSILLDISGLSANAFNETTDKLIQFGLLNDKEYVAIDSCEIPKPLLNKLITEAVTTRDSLIEPKLKPSPVAQFKLDDFPQVNTDLLSGYLEKSTLAQQRGISILLYGGSGTGKTELARTLVEHCGHVLYEIRSTGLSKCHGDDEFQTRHPNKERLRYLSLLSSLLTNQSHAMLLIDECESLFEQADMHYSKEHLQRFIEDNAIPCIWITNHVHCLEPSFIRRFKLVTEVPPPRPEDIQRVCKHYFKDLSLSAQFKRNITRTNNISPAVIANAAHVAKTLGNKRTDAENTMLEIAHSTLRASDLFDDKAQYHGDLAFNPALLNLKHKSVQLDDVDYALKHNKPARILLMGPPGTGKTAYAHYLAERNKRELIRVKCSDVLSKWVGESEQNVAELFHRAHVDEKIILLDEVDSLLVSRDTLSAHHDMQLVNEFLTQIECFTQPLFAATNFESKLDKAVLRRFDFKLECDYLTPEQVCQLYKQVLAINKITIEEAHQLRQLHHLTPGDFAILARRQVFRPAQNHRLSAITLLAEENQRKQPKTQMGFIRPF